MHIDEGLKKMPYHFSAVPSRSGDQWWFNIPGQIIKSNFIDIDKKYTVYFVEKDLNPNVKDLSYDQILSYYNFPAKPAKHSINQYHFTIPKRFIEDQYIFPEEKKKYWLFFIEEM